MIVEVAGNLDDIEHDVKNVEFQSVALAQFIGRNTIEGRFWTI